MLPFFLCFWGQGITWNGYLFIYLFIYLFQPPQGRRYLTNEYNIYNFVHEVLYHYILQHLKCFGQKISKKVFKGPWLLIVFMVE